MQHSNFQKLYVGTVLISQLIKGGIDGPKIDVTKLVICVATSEKNTLQHGHCKEFKRYKTFKKY